MSASKKKSLALTLLSPLLLVSFLILMSTFKGETDVLRMSLAGVGFIGFAVLTAAVLRAMFKDRKS